MIRKRKQIMIDYLRHLRNPSTDKKLHNYAEGPPTNPYKPGEEIHPAIKKKELQNDTSKLANKCRLIEELLLDEKKASNQYWDLGLKEMSQDEADHFRILKHSKEAGKCIREGKIENITLEKGKRILS